MDAETRQVVVRGDHDFAASLRGFGPVGIVAILAIILSGNIVLANMFVVPAGATLAVIWAWRSRTPWSEIGYVRPKRWMATIAGGFAFGAALKIVMKAIVMPLFGADPINHAYRFLSGNRAMLPVAIWGMIVAGFAEETVFRGYLFERFTKLLGHGLGERIAIVLLTSGWFGLGHLATQGIAGVEQATIVGLIYGTIFAATGRLFMLMAAHASFNLTALAIIYWDVEVEVARLVFNR